MQLAWSNPQLEGCCVSAAALGAVFQEQAQAAEDLLNVVAHVVQLDDIGAFRCVRVGVKDGFLTLSIQEVDMHVRPLNADGTVCEPVLRPSLLGHSRAPALLIHDLHVRGRSILRPES